MEENHSMELADYYILTVYHSISSARCIIISMSMMKVPRSEKLHILPKVTQKATLALPENKARIYPP